MFRYFPWQRASTILRPETHETKVTHDISTDSITNLVPVMWYVQIVSR